MLSFDIHIALLLSQLTLEFYERRKGRWIIFAENSSWEMWKLKVNVVRIKTDAGEFYWQIKSSNMLLIITSNRVATASKKTSRRTSRKGNRTSNSHLQLDIVLCCRYNTYVGLLISLNTFPRTQLKRTSQMYLIHSSPKYNPTFTTSITN